MIANHRIGQKVKVVDHWEGHDGATGIVRQLAPADPKNHIEKAVHVEVSTPSGAAWLSLRYDQISPAR